MCRSQFSLCSCFPSMTGQVHSTFFFSHTCLCHSLSLSSSSPFYSNCQAWSWRSMPWLSLWGEPMPIAKAPVENNTNFRETDKLNKARANKAPGHLVQTWLALCFLAAISSRQWRSYVFFDTGTPATILKFRPILLASMKSTKKRIWSTADSCCREIDRFFVDFRAFDQLRSCVMVRPTLAHWRWSQLGQLRASRFCTAPTWVPSLHKHGTIFFAFRNMFHLIARDRSYLTRHNKTISLLSGFCSKQEIKQCDVSKNPAMTQKHHTL